ncbi:Hypothetical predicted protein [Olea europaea subsp. europaea]|uniref:Uncharacterized protein n=1 Tax=Olea europaea subsp. europaea TaxID=158383 RepID=A0A8S0PGJ7_OLEEU|nr:Hypothetical predicted protein [Olea europaea subsp. europaea]
MGIVKETDCMTNARKIQTSLTSTTTLSPKSEHDDVEYDRNVIDGIEIGLDRRQDEVQPERKECIDIEDEVQPERKECIDIEVDELELPSSDKLFSQCSSDEDGGHHFPEFNFDQDMKNPQFEDWFQGNIEPVVPQCDRAVNERGKMVPERGQQASSSHNLGNELTFHFIPTPMLSRELLSGGPKSGDTAMVVTQPDLVHVPTDDVNFEDVMDDIIDRGDAESGSTRVSKPRKSKCTRRKT